MDERSPGEGGAVPEGILLAWVAQLLDQGAGIWRPHHRQEIQGASRASGQFPANASARRQLQAPIAVSRKDAKSSINSGAGPVELGVPAQDVGQVKPSAYNVAVGGPLAFENFRGALDHPFSLEGWSIDLLRTQGQSLDILQEEESSLLAPPPAPYGLAPVHDGPDSILGMTAGYRPDDNAGQTLAPGGMTLYVSDGAICREVSGAEGRSPGGHN